MTTRISGLASGMDTDALVKSMLDAHKLKNKRVTDKQTLLTWQQDKWKDLNAKLYKLYTDDLSKVKMQGNYQQKSVTSSNDKLVSATGTPTTPDGAHTLTIDKLASAQYLTGAQITKDKNGNSITAKSSTKLADLGITPETLINISSGGTKKTLEVTSNTTIADFVNKAKEAGLNASFDEKQGRFFISSKVSGAANSFQITATTSTATAPKNEILNSIDYSTLSTTDKAKADSAIAVLADSVSVPSDKDAATQVLADFAKNKVLKLIESGVDAVITAEVTPTAIASEHTAIRAEVMQEQLIVLQEEARVNGATDEEIAAITEGSLNEEQLSNITTLQDTKIASSTIRINTAVTTAITEAIATEKALAPADRYSQAIIDRNDEVVAADGALRTLATTYTTSSQTAEGDVNSQIAGLGFDALNADGTKATTLTTSSVVVASDSKVTYNGAELTSSTNVINANGMALTLTGTTAVGETISLNVTNNVQANYDMVKKFITSYNSILKEMNELYYSESAKGYDPLSDDERESMTDGQIEKWETKIKDSILRRDSNLGTLSTSMKSAMTSSVAVGGKNYSLSSYGIQTSFDYGEKGLLHIYGDTEDSTYSTYDDKLKKALEEDPDTVMKVLSGISSKLYDTMNTKMKSVPNVRSAFTFYNDKTMSKLQSSYAKQVEEQEDKLLDLEDKYYKQFTAMETAMAKLQSQSNALAGLLGTSNR